jgi:sugar/nucleoside kinase (ribokinase family)
MLTIVGNTTVDIYVRGLARLPQASDNGAGALPVQTGERVLPTLGGGGAVTAFTAAGLGELVRLWSAVGTDPFGELALNWLEGRKVDTASVRIMGEAGTATTVVLSDEAHRRESFYYPGASGVFAPRARSVSGGIADWLLVADYTQLPGWRGLNALELLRNARRAGVNTALDLGTEVGGEPLGKAELESLLGNVNVLLSDAPGLERVAGASLEASARWARGAGVGAVVVRQGAQGATIFEGDAAEGTQVPGFQMSQDDVPGVPHSFNAGFLFERGRAASIVDSVRFANAVAALVTNSQRGVLDAPDEQAVRALLKRET